MTSRRLCRAEFERLFLLLYPSLVKAGGHDAVHSVYIAVLDGELYKDTVRSRRKVLAWVLALIREQVQVQFREEKRQFGRRRINERD